MHRTTVVVARAFVLSLAVSLAVAAFTTSVRAQGGITRVSVGSQGQQGHDVARDPSFSADGRRIAFMYRGTNFDPADTNPDFDVYVHNRDTGQTTWISHLPDGTAPQFGGYFPCMSADGTKVAFDSSSPLVAGDTGFGDVFVRDLVASTTVRASVGLGNGQTNGHSGLAKISSDGRFVAFLSFATNLILFDANGGSFNDGNDAFVRDLVAGTTELVHVSSTGVQGDSSIHFEIDMSADGRFVAFASRATNLVAGDTNLGRDVFVRDRLLGVTERVSVASDGSQGNAESGVGGVTLSADGRFVVFPSGASNLALGDTNPVTDIFVRDRALNLTERVNVAPGGLQGSPPGVPTDSCCPAISADGRFVAFGSEASMLVPFDVNNIGDTFVRDRWLDLTRMVSLTPAGLPGNSGGGGNGTRMTPDGKWLAFSSHSSDFVPGDTNGLSDVFVLERERVSPSAYCTATTSSQGCAPAMAWTGAPSETGGTGFVLHASNVLANKFGLLLYGVQGPTAVAYPGGTLCVRSPRRGPLHQSGGASGCDGVLACDFNTFIASGADPALYCGRSVWSQFYSRDPQALTTLNLSNAVFFVIEP